MTDRFIDNFTPGDGTDGLTWAKAELTAAAVDAADAAGDRWLFDSRHSESTNAAITLAVAGSLATPSQLLSVTQSGASGVASLTAGAVIATGNGAYPIALNGVGYVYGINFNPGVGAASASATLTLSGTAGSSLMLDACAFYLGTTGTGARLIFGSSSASAVGTVYISDCTARFSATAQGLNILQANVFWRGGGLHSSTSAITAFIATAPADGILAVFDGLDLSYGATSMNLVASGATAAGKITFRNCKLPATWSGGLFAGTPSTSAFRVEMWNCSASDTNYAMWVEDYAGSIKHETTIVRTGGASDGDTPLSWKMASSANAEYPAIVLRSPEIYVPNTTVAASKTLTVEIAQDGTTTALNDDEIWLEVEYLGTSGTPLALFADDAKSDVLASAAAQTDSTETWSGLSGTNKKQKLSVTITPQEEGVYIARVCLAKASTTVYVDPKVTVS